MAKVLLEQEYSLYESPKIDVIQITTKDVVCTSPISGDEGDGQYDNNWGI